MAIVYTVYNHWGKESSWTDMVIAVSFHLAVTDWVIRVGAWRGLERTNLQDNQLRLFKKLGDFKRFSW